MVALDYTLHILLLLLITLSTFLTNENNAFCVEGILKIYLSSTNDVVKENTYNMFLNENVVKENIVKITVEKKRVNYTNNPPEVV